LIKLAKLSPEKLFNIGRLVFDVKKVLIFILIRKFNPGNGYGFCELGEDVPDYSSVTTIDELKDALEKTRQDSVSTLIDIKVLPGTMTEGYELKKPRWDK